MTLKRQSFTLSLVLFLLLVFIIAACGGDDEDDRNEENSNSGGNGDTSQEVVEQPDNDTVPGLPTPTPRLVTFTPAPSPTITATPTLPYDINRYWGDWSLFLRMEVTNAPYADLYRYSGSTVNMQVNLDGTVTGSGQLQPYVVDEDCTVTLLTDTASAPPDEEDENSPFGTGTFNFNVQGQLRVQGEDVWMDVEILPEDYLVMETYQRICQDYRESGNVDIRQVWMVLGETNNLRMTIPLIGNAPYTITLQENLDQRTSMLSGMLDVEITLYR
jgi:hypothetical protein